MAAIAQIQRDATRGVGSHGRLYVCDDCASLVHDDIAEVQHARPAVKPVGGATVDMTAQTTEPANLRLVGGIDEADDERQAGSV